MFLWFLVAVCIDFVLVYRVSMVAGLQSALLVWCMIEYGEGKEDG